MRRYLAPGLVGPLLLAASGALLIVVGQVDWGGLARASLPPIVVPSGSPEPTQVPSGATPAPTPTASSVPADWVAVQLQVPSVGINVAVHQSTSGSMDGYPPLDGVYVLHNSNQPGRGGNSYLIGHATYYLFKPLWNVWVGDEIQVLMSDGQVLRYQVTEVHPNQACPEAGVPAMPDPPLALQYAPSGCPGARWIRPTDHERLTLQTSQGYNRNYGEFIVVAEPI
ncbi:MAG TPA: class F sortase [Candidatus Limnocylindria bacterium]|nr:class F sortase [Candidatus Limnocylindria bacterium]